MTVNETLQASETTTEFKKSFSNIETMVYSCGVEAAKTGYNEMTLAGSQHAQTLNVAPSQTVLQATVKER